MDLYQTVLPSGRGVRYRLLTPSQLDATLLSAAMLVGKDASPTAVNLSRAREAIKAMLHSVTKAPLVTKTETLPDGTIKITKPIEQLASATWEKLNAEKLELPGPLSYDALFNARDDAALGHIYQSGHALTQAEAEDIVGKAQPVSVD